MQSVKSNFNKLLYLAIIITAIIAGWGLSQIFSNSSVSSNQINMTFELTDHNGQSLTSGDLKNKSKVIFFGFTNCPDVCPISTDLMSALINNISTAELNLDSIEFLFITTDPKRDNPERMKNYLSDYNSKIIGLTGEHVSLKKVWKNFFVHVLPASGGAHDHSKKNTEEVSGYETDDYMVEHTAFYYLFNGDDELSAILPFGTSEEILLTEIKRIL